MGYFKFFIEFVSMLLLSYIIVLGHKACEINSKARNRSNVPVLKGRVPTTRQPEKLLEVQPLP